MNESNLNQIDTVLVSTEQSGKFADANICMARMRDGKDESLSFENKTAVFCIYPPTDNPEYVKISADGFDIANDVPTGSTHTSLETIHVSTTTADSVWVSILVPSGLKVSDLTFSDGTKEKSVTTGATADKEIAAGTLYTVTNENWKSTEADIPDGALEGVFTVGAGPDGEAGTADDVKVYFSQGNLQATINESGTPTDWKFAPNQYDYLGASGANTAIGSATGDVDLFGWSTSSTTYGISTSTSDNDYSGDFKDWGEAYCESNSISPDNTWRTLSKDEWCYLFAYNPETSQFKEESPRYNLYKTGVTVCGKENCVVLLPDGWEWDGPTVGTDWQDGGYPETQTGNEVIWQKMEDAGAVCLPAAGTREGSDAYGSGNAGYYWSSTADREDSAYSAYFFSSDPLEPAFGDSRNCGYSVRLVTDVSATPTEPEYVVMKMGTGASQYTRKWATKNLGATTVSGSYATCAGDYYQWGSVNTIYNEIPWNTWVAGVKKVSIDSWKSGKSSGFDWMSYCEKEQFEEWAPAPYDNTTNILSADYDVAQKEIGNGWRMPTFQEFQDLYDACVGTGGYDKTTKPTTGKPNSNGVYWCDSYDGVSGYLFYDGTNVLFFPAAGEGSDTNLIEVGNIGCYWSSTFSGTEDAAYVLGFDASSITTEFAGVRYYGGLIRPVADL